MATSNPVNSTPAIDSSAALPSKSTARKPLRLWPGVVLAGLVVLLKFVIPTLFPNAQLGGVPVSGVTVFGALIASLLIIIWWLFFSRALWIERIGALLLMPLGVFATYRLVHVSIAGGAMGFLLPVLALPFLCLAMVVWAAGTRHASNKSRRVLMVAIILLPLVGFTLIRTGGFTGDFDNDFQWRWSKTPEQLLLERGEEPAAPASEKTNAGLEWPGFRGSERDGVVNGVRIETDWTKTPPVEMWRRPVGPGWSSFAVSGDFVYTQEQRGNDELVACYDLKTGKPVWRHRDAARFYESNAGAGPRGTPTLSNGRVYTLGATGIVNALDSTNGKVVWTRNAATDTKTKIPGWGFSSSPLVVEDVVVVAAAGNLVAYNITDGQPVWFRLEGGSGYSSPQLVKINGTPQILMLTVNGAVSLAPNDGKQLWEFPLAKSARIVQPAMTTDGDVLVHDGEGSTMRRLAVAQSTSGWTVQERWTADGLNPYFNDFVVQGNYAYGFSGGNLACADLKDGERKWTGGNYGHGQLVLLRDQSLLIVLSESGDVALVKAVPEGFSELARLSAIKGKTWNHPVVAGEVLLVRNGEEMAAFKLPMSRG